MMPNRALRLAGGALPGALAAGPVLAQTAPAPEPRRFALAIGAGDGAMTIHRDASGRMAMTRTALMSAPLPYAPGRAVTVGSGSNEMTIHVADVPMTPARR